jgi:predicted restriction endonuclease
MCGLRLTIRGRGYSEAAHIRALGRSHGGPDVPGNVLCLCPNCHVRFDGGAVLITDHLRIVEVNGASAELPLRTVSRHVIQIEHLAYHRSVHGRS